VGILVTFVPPKVTARRGMSNMPPRSTATPPKRTAATHNRTAAKRNSTPRSSTIVRRFKKTLKWTTLILQTNNREPAIRRFPVVCFSLFRQSRNSFFKKKTPPRRMSPNRTRL